MENLSANGDLGAQTPPVKPRNGAEALLLGLKRNGVDYLFANAGTDFPPIIEALASLPHDEIPVALTIPHETAAVGMAHGYYLVTGKAQAVMVHVNVGLANAAMGVINAASDNVPVIVMSGRTPITERGRQGSRVTPIQYGQEMYDQASLISGVTKFHYEMRYPEQGELLTRRAATLALSEPRGPVYLSLPREPLSEAIPAGLDGQAPVQTPASPPHADPAAIKTLAQWFQNAQAPLILCQRGDVEGRLSRALADFADRFAVPVVEPFSVRNVLPSAHPMFLGNDPSSAIDTADQIIVLDSDVPWIEKLHHPAAGKRIAHIGPDPHFARMPVRGYQTDLAIAADPAAALAALASQLPEHDDRRGSRREQIAGRAAARRAATQTAAEAGNGAPMSAEWMSLCISQALDDQAVVFGELGVVPGAMHIAGGNRVFCNPHSGGLGWALPAALGAQLADRSRLVVACVGDGSYMFANPVACHQIAEALELPVLTIIKNNGLWNAVRRSVLGAYPDGAAARANLMPLTSLEPAPDYLMVAGASRAYTERVESGAELPAALQRAINVIRTQKRQVVLELRVAVSDKN